MILSPDGKKQSFSCDSVHLIITEDDKGKRGGSYGIRQGHMKALISLDKGEISAHLKGEKIFSVVTEGGFATVENDVVTCVITSI